MVSTTFFNIDEWHSLRLPFIAQTSDKQTEIVFQMNANELCQFISYCETHNIIVAICVQSKG